MRAAGAGGAGDAVSKAATVRAHACGPGRLLVPCSNHRGRGDVRLKAPRRVQPVPAKGQDPFPARARQPGPAAPITSADTMPAAETDNPAPHVILPDAAAPPTPVARRHLG